MASIIDGCTAWVLSQWLNSHAAANTCCNLHDETLSVTHDWGVFWQANAAFRDCLSQWNGIVGLVAWILVCSPIGMWLFAFGKKAVVKVRTFMDTGPVT